MRLTVLRPEDYTETAWSGGTTTQMAIEPHEAVYAEKDFLWRLSSATVEREESDFTPLPGYDRVIATLRGSIILRHNGGIPAVLGPYEVHTFSGDDATTCSGMCTDFNLMLRRGRCGGTVKALRCVKSEELRPEARAETVLLYCAEGSCSVACAGQVAWLDAGETLRVEEPKNIRIGGTAVLMCAQVWKL